MARWRLLFGLAGVGVGGMCILGLCVCGGAWTYGTVTGREKSRIISEANALWDAGKKKEAVAIYKPILRDEVWWVDAPERPKLFTRVVEHDLQNRDFDSVRHLLKIARENDVKFSDHGVKDNPHLAALLASKELQNLPFERNDKLTVKDTRCPHILGFVPLTTDGSPSKSYDFLLAKGDTVIITMKSGQVDSLVIVENVQGKVLNYNDDDPNVPVNRTLHSWLRFTAPEDGFYRVLATCMTGHVNRKEGDFQLAITLGK